MPTPLLIRALVDDAGLFPPTALPMTEAVERHRRDLAADHPVHTGRFLVRASDVAALQGALGDDDRFDLGLILDAPLDALGEAVTRIADDPRLRLTGIELVLPAGDPGAAAEAVAAATSEIDAPVFVEIPLAGAEPDRTRAALAAVHERSLGAKVRCGGLAADKFPSAEALGAFLVEATSLGAPFKCTAGLHHAMRYVDDLGFQHHGVLNILVALLRAADADAEAVTRALGCDDAEALASEVTCSTADAQQAARALLVAYGSCSTSQPVDDLAGLGLTVPLER